MAALDDGASFDFVIVGAGAAGCVLANRLSEDPATRVCVLEAGGPDDDYRIAMPAGAIELAARANAHNWAYQSAPQRHLGGRALMLAGGRGWGGSSAIGRMIYLRGPAGVYDGWRDGGLIGWGSDDLAPYFARTERTLAINASQSKNEIFRAFVEAADEAGYKRVRDFTSAGEGAGYLPLTIHDGARASASSVYLRAVTGIRSNLTIISNAHVTRLVFEDGRAGGVEYAAGPARRLRKIVDARAEIIVCAGAVQSPALLMRSGIGEPIALTALGIAVHTAARNVGRQLADQPVVHLAFECPLPITRHARTSGMNALAMAARHRLRREGPGRFADIEAGALLKTRGEIAAPDIEMHAIAGLLGPESQGGFTMAVAPTQPKSRGQVSLTSADPFAPPRIDPDFLADESDVRTLRDGVRMAREIAAKPAFQIYRGRELAPGATIRTDGETDAWIRRAAQSLAHPTGTCAMGADESAVLDANLRVRGVNALRVIDASAMPTPAGADPYASVTVLAEKGADLILGRKA